MHVCMCIYNNIRICVYLCDPPETCRPQGVSCSSHSSNERTQTRQSRSQPSKPSGKFLGKERAREREREIAEKIVETLETFIVQYTLLFFGGTQLSCYTPTKPHNKWRGHVPGGSERPSSPAEERERETERERERARASERGRGAGREGGRGRERVRESV